MTAGVGKLAFEHWSSVRLMIGARLLRLLSCTARSEKRADDAREEGREHVVQKSKFTEGQRSFLYASWHQSLVPYTFLHKSPLTARNLTIARSSKVRTSPIFTAPACFASPAACPTRLKNSPAAASTLATWFGSLRPAHQLDRQRCTSHHHSRQAEPGRTRLAGPARACWRQSTPSRGRCCGCC